MYGHDNRDAKKYKDVGKKKIYQESQQYKNLERIEKSQCRKNLNQVIMDAKTEQKDENSEKDLRRIEIQNDKNHKECCAPSTV